MTFEQLVTTDDSLPAIAGVDPSYLEPENDTLIQLTILQLKLADVVGVELDGSSKDAWVWLDWMKNGRSRPKLNKRSADAIRTAQNLFCAKLDDYWGLIDWTNPVHFGLVERVTRPLPAVYSKHAPKES